MLKDGDFVKVGDVAFLIEGSSQKLLTAERLVLNVMQRMSAIATKTNYLQSLCKGTKAKVIDTRKTTPRFKLFEKWAVLIGGGYNHRMGLFDMIMLKDNHIDMAGGIAQSIQRTKEYLRANNKRLQIEIETRNLNEVREVLLIGDIDIIMLDNMSLTDVKDAVKIINGRYQTEASGGITENNIQSFAKCGVDQGNSEGALQFREACQGA